MKIAQLAAEARKATARARERISSGLSKIELAKILSRIKREPALMRERIVSLGSMHFAADDPKLFWVSGLLFLIFQATISALLWRVANPWEIFAHQVSISPDEFLVQRDNWGPEKIRFYLQHYWLDFIHPAVYAVFFRCLLTQIQLSYPTQYIYHSMAFPIGAAIYDEIENICQMALMAGWTESKFVFYAGAFGALAKWLLLTATFAAIGHAVWKAYWDRQLEG